MGDAEIVRLAQFRAKKEKQAVRAKRTSRATVVFTPDPALSEAVGARPRATHRRLENLYVRLEREIRAANRRIASVQAEIKKARELLSRSWR